MQLALTADRKFWGDASELLFLGEWCKLYSEKEHWKLLSSKTLPYHWNDRARYRQDAEMIACLSMPVLESVSQALNRLHSTQHSIRYWKVLVGPWLETFLAVLYDRFLSIEGAFATGEVSEVCVPASVPKDWPVQDTHQFFCEILEDRYNLHLYADLIRFLNLPGYREILSTSQQNDLEPHPLDHPPALKRIVKKFAKMWAKSFSFLGPRYVFVSSYLGKKDLLELQWKLGQIPSPDYFGDHRIVGAYRPGVRKEFASFLKLNPTNKFLEWVSKMIPQEMPRAFLEGYEDLERSAQKQFPSSAKAVFTANAHVYHEPFKHWAASLQEKGTPLVLSQHGGQTGVGLWGQSDEHDLQAGNFYFSWGWTREGVPQCLPLPTGKLARFKAKPNPEGKILLVMNGFPRYFYRSYSIPVAEQALQYLGDQVQFVKSLNPPVSQLIEIRKYPINYRWFEAERLRDQLPGVVFSSANSFKAALGDARLFVGNHNTTTFLETLRANFPTILFWNPEHWELHPDAAPYFDMLKQAGIFFESPQEAAEKVNEVAEDPLAWWMQNEAQTARRTFCQNFAHTSVDWKRHWAAALEKVATSSALQQPELNLSFSNGIKASL